MSFCWKLLNILRWSVAGKENRRTLRLWNLPASHPGTSAAPGTLWEEGGIHDVETRCPPGSQPWVPALVSPALRLPAPRPSSVLFGFLRKPCFIENCVLKTVIPMIE